MRHFLILYNKYIVMTSLNVGDKAPDFVALNEFGKSTSLSDFIGKKLFFISILRI